MTTTFGQTQLFTQFLTQSGNGLGAINAIGNYSGASTEWYIQPTVGETISINMLTISVADSGTYDGTDYGAIAGLINGVQITVKRDGAITSIFGTNNFKNNFELICAGPGAQSIVLAGDQQVLLIRFNFQHDFLGPLVLFNSDRLSVNLSDNFTGLVSHKFCVCGIRKT